MIKLIDSDQIGDEIQSYNGQSVRPPFSAKDLHFEEHGSPNKLYIKLNLGSARI